MILFNFLSFLMKIFGKIFVFDPDLGYQFWFVVSGKTIRFPTDQGSIPVLGIWYRYCPQNSRLFFERLGGSNMNFYRQIQGWGGRGSWQTGPGWRSAGKDGRIQEPWGSLIVPDFTISVCGSSCNCLFFGLIFAFFASYFENEADKRVLYELPFTKMLKSGTIGLASVV